MQHMQFNSYIVDIQCVIPKVTLLIISTHEFSIIFHIPSKADATLKSILDLELVLPSRFDYKINVPISIRGLVKMCMALHVLAPDIFLKIDCFTNESTKVQNARC